jgi:hypothetical protein
MEIDDPVAIFVQQLADKQFAVKRNYKICPLGLQVFEHQFRELPFIAFANDQGGDAMQIGLGDRRTLAIRNHRMDMVPEEAVVEELIHH